MKTVLLIILVLYPPSLAFSQNPMLTYYINGVEVNFENIFINPNCIESMTVKKETTNGELYIVTKEREWKYKSLEMFVKSLYNYKQIFNDSVIPIFMIGKNVIANPDSVRIDSSYFGEATINRLSNVKGVSEACKRLIVVYIKLADKPIIYIRGKSTEFQDTIIN